MVRWRIKTVMLVMFLFLELCIAAYAIEFIYRFVGEATDNSISAYILGGFFSQIKDIIEVKKTDFSLA